MNWSSASGLDARDELSREVSSQLTRAREILESGKDLGPSVHEARRAIKRARALLKLADPQPGDSHTDWTLRDASRALALIRDADVLVLTAKDICNESPPSGAPLVPTRLLEALEDERRRSFAESGSDDEPLRKACDLLRSAALELREPTAPGALISPHSPTSGNIEATVPSRSTTTGMELVRLGLDASYTAARVRSDPAAGEGPADQRSHKLRKRVKDLCYQLDFLDTGHPKLGRLVLDLHHLTDLLGDRNDLATLSEFTASDDSLGESERARLLTRVEEGKQALGSEATALSARLFEEEADAFVRRIEEWLTPPPDSPQSSPQG